MVQFRMVSASGYVPARAESSLRSVAERAVHGMPEARVAEM
jgi:hypothetical protein